MVLHDIPNWLLKYIFLCMIHECSGRMSFTVICYRRFVTIIADNWQSYFRYFADSICLIYRQSTEGLFVLDDKSGSIIYVDNGLNNLLGTGRIRWTLKKNQYIVTFSWIMVVRCNFLSLFRWLFTNAHLIY